MGVREPKSPGERARVTGLRERSKGFQLITTWPLRRKEGHSVSLGTHYLSEKDIFPLLSNSPGLLLIIWNKHIYKDALFYGINVPLLLRVALSPIKINTLKS